MTDTFLRKPRKPLLPLNIQFFAEGDPDEPPAEPPTDPADPPQDPPPADPPEATFTKEQVEEMIKDRLKRAEKDKEKAVKEAEKLAKMNEDQKKQYEFEKLQQELEEYKKKDAFYSLSKEASKMLSESDITADDELLQFVVKDTAEETQTAVNAFVKLINSKVEEGVKKALAGTPPKVNPNPGTKNPFSKEHFNLTEQAKLYKENPELYKQLKAQAKKD